MTCSHQNNIHSSSNPSWLRTTALKKEKNYYFFFILNEVTENTEAKYYSSEARQSIKRSSGKGHHEILKANVLNVKKIAETTLIFSKNACRP